MNAKELITIGRPGNVDLAVPLLVEGRPSGLNIKQIAEGFSEWVTRDWVRAVNVEYRAGASGPSVSVLVEGGTIWATGDPRWPVGVSVTISILSAICGSLATWAFTHIPR